MIISALMPGTMISTKISIIIPQTIINSINTNKLIILLVVILIINTLITISIEFNAATTEGKDCCTIRHDYQRIWKAFG